jgi:hypothetical protein
MAPRFKPPARNSLAEADRAEGVVYGDQCIVVEGVVSAASGGGWCGPNDGYDIHCIEFAAWRRRGGSLIARELTLLRPVPPMIRNGLPDEKKIFDQLPAYSTQRLSVLLSQCETRAVVAKVLKISRPDETLLAYVERLRKPVVVSTKQFGDLTLDPSVGWFAGKKKWGRNEIELHVQPDNKRRVDAALKTATSLWSNQAAWQRKVEEFAVKELLALKNEDWLGDSETKVTAKEFKKRMKLVSINVAGNGRFEFWHEDGDLFWGHSILIRGNLKKGLIDADIPG